MAKKLSDSEQVTAHIQKLDAELQDTVESIRQMILQSHADIGEQIKWNNPSFYYTCEMADFDPKEYKRDIAVFNLFKGRIMLVFPSGSRLSDPEGLLEGKYADGRRLLVFKDLADAKARKKHLQQLFKEWISLVDQ